MKNYKLSVPAIGSLEGSAALASMHRLTTNLLCGKAPE